MKYVRQHTSFLFALAILLVLVWFALIGSADADLTITVRYNKGWGDAPTSNIKKLCENVALHFQEHLRDAHKVSGDLTIVYRAGAPIAFYRTYFGGGPDEYKIGLTVTGLYWNNFSYQFGHEFCHIMTSHDEITKNNPNDWFHEAICELAAVWVLRQMGETWENRAPYWNWKDYRHNLTNYANDLLNRPEVQYAGTGAEWLQEWEDALRNDDMGVFSYKRVSQLSYKFLDIFEENPEAWNAVRQMPASKGKLSEYMKDWYAKVDTEDQQYVEAIAEVMGITVEDAIPVTAIIIDADVNDDGYVDLSDVLIVRSAMTRPNTYDTDVNNDGDTNILDLLIVKAKAVEAIIAAAPPKRKVKTTTWGSMKTR